MGRRSRSKSGKERRAPVAAGPPPGAAPPRLAGVVCFVGAAIAVLASWVALDPRSIDAFDAPKVLLAQAGLAAAAGAALWARLIRPKPFRPGPGRTSRTVLLLL